MFRRAIAAAVLVITVSPVFAAEFAGRTLGQAADMAAGKAPAGTSYDGSSSLPAVRAQIPGAMAAPGSAVMPPSAALRSPSREDAVPAPVAQTASAPSFDQRAWTQDLRHAAQGPLGAPIGALFGLLAGATIAFTTSKFLS